MSFVVSRRRLRKLALLRMETTNAACAQQHDRRVNPDQVKRYTVSYSILLIFYGVFLDSSGLEGRNGGSMTISTRSDLPQISVFYKTQVCKVKKSSYLDRVYLHAHLIEIEDEFDVRWWT